MKTLTALAFWIAVTCFGAFAQNESPIPHISQQMTDYFGFYPEKKIFIATDKQCYKPGEIIWFSALVTSGKTLLPDKESQELIVKLYNNKGESLAFEKLLVTNGSTPGDIDIPDNLPRGQYFLIAYTSAQITAEEAFCSILDIDPAYSNQWIVSVTAKDSISIAGQKNELTLLLRNLSGEVEKNTTLRYQLLNGKEIIDKGKLKTDDAGNVILPFTLPDKSNGEPFICELTDNKEEWKKEIFLPSNIDPLEIIFYPEGNSIVSGVPTKIGFTAFNKWGIPVNIEGSLVNQDGKQVGIVKTFTSGLGLFPVENDGKQKLKLVLSGKTGKNQTFDLPSPINDGLAFSLIKTDADFISASLNFADKQKHTIAMTATYRSNLYWAADMDINGIGRIKIPTENLPQGINLLSVFTNDGKLLATRLVLVDKKQHLNVDVQPETSNLKQGETLKIKIRLTDENNKPVSGNVSVSIADSFRKTTINQQIEQYMLAGQELETPFSLISTASQGQIINPVIMNVFMIANRQKGFDWQKIMQFKPENATVNNSGNNSISGIVTDKNGNKINKAKVSLVNNRNMQLLTTTTNQDGLFSFPNLNQANKEDFSAKATDPEGKRELNIVFNRNFESLIACCIANISMKYRLLNDDLATGSTYFKNNPDLFDRAPKIVKTNNLANQNQKTLLRSGTNLMDVIKSIKPYRIMNNQIVFMGTENSLNYQGGALIVLDGQKLGTDVSAIQNISPAEVDHINVSTNLMDIQRYTGFNSVGLIEIFTKKAPEFPTPEKLEAANQYNGEYRIPKVFQVDSPNSKSDFRTTLLWIPELSVDETGEAEISVTAGKVLSDFVIEVQGMSTNGRMGSGNGKFTVEK